MTLFDDTPELIESVKVTIAQIDKTLTPYSDGVAGRRETINHIVRGASVQLDAQVVFGNTDQRAVELDLGTDEQSKGYILVRYKDLEDAGVDLQRGDKITKMGQLDVEYYILHSQGDPTAQFTSIGGFTLTRMFFSDRTPKK